VPSDDEWRAMAPFFLNIHIPQTVDSLKMEILAKCFSSL
jgi:hypothetical protein